MGVCIGLVFVCMFDFIQVYHKKGVATFIYYCQTKEKYFYAKAKLSKAEESKLP